MVLYSTEDVEHLQICDWLCTYHPGLWSVTIHIANQRKCSVTLGRKLKRMGVKRGVSDFFFPRSNGEYKGLWLELKAQKGKPSKEQLAFIEKMKKEGYDGHVVWGAQDAIDLISDFYGL